MTGVWEFEELDGLEQFIIDMVAIAKDDLIKSGHERADEIDELSLERIVIRGPWGRGTAEKGEDPLDAMLFFSLNRQEEDHLIPYFQFIIDTVGREVSNIIQTAQYVPGEEAQEWFHGLDVTPFAMSRFPDKVNLSLGRAEGNTVFDLTRAEAIEFSESVNFRNLPRIPLETLREDVEQRERAERLSGLAEEAQEREEQQEQEGEELPELPPAEEEEPEEEEYLPDVEPHVRDYAVDANTLQAPAGKETKKIERTVPYEFEVQAGMAGFQSHIPITDRFEGMIGNSVFLGDFGIQDPPGTFPRTGLYIKARLKYEGPTYIYQLYKDLVFYSAYISGIYEGNFDAGTYQSFREFVYRLDTLPKSGKGPQLIEKIPPEQAQEMGFDTVPDHPTIEGEKAPWLQPRQFIRLIEVNEGHSAWNNIYAYLFESDAEAG